MVGEPEGGPVLAVGGIVGLAAVLIGVNSFIHSAHAPEAGYEKFHLGEVYLGLFIGAVAFSVIGYLFVKHQGKGKVAPRFIPQVVSSCEEGEINPETAEDPVSSTQS